MFEALQQKTKQQHGVMYEVQGLLVILLDAIQIYPFRSHIARKPLALSASTRQKWTFFFEQCEGNRCRTVFRISAEASYLDRRRASDFSRRGVRSQRSHQAIYHHIASFPVAKKRSAYACAPTARPPGLAAAHPLVTIRRCTIG